MISPLGSSPLASDNDRLAVIGAVNLPIRVIDLTPEVAAGEVSVAAPVSTAGVWALVVEIDGVDVSDRLLGEVVVEAEENAARVADFSLVVAGEVVDVAAWTGCAVAISFGAAQGLGATNLMRIFTGSVEIPSIDPDTRILALHCSDNRQGIIAGLSKAQIEKIIPGSFWSAAVFSPAASAWDEVNDRLSTIPAALDLTPFGNLRLTPLAAKSSPDFVFLDDLVLDGGAKPEIAARSDMTNRVDITFGYRYPRVKAEGYVVTYDYLFDTPGFADWVRDGNAFLIRSQVIRALEAAGATVVEIVWTPLPSHAVMLPGGAAAWVPNPYTDNLLCLGFSALVTFDYVQEQDEIHGITVSCEQSIDAVGVVRESMTGALQGRYCDLVAAEAAIKSYRQSESSLPPRDIAIVQRGVTTAKAATLTQDTDRAAADDAMRCLMAIAATKIKRAHRRSTVLFRVPCWPALDVDKTVMASARGVSANGKVRKFVHRIRPDDGSAITECQLAISRAAGVGFGNADDAIYAPQGVADGATGALPQPVVTWNGLSGQDQQITIEFPGVEEAERQLAIAHIETDLSVSVPEDFLEILL